MPNLHEKAEQHTNITLLLARLKNKKALPLAFVIKKDTMLTYDSLTISFENSFVVWRNDRKSNFNYMMLEHGKDRSHYSNLAKLLGEGGQGRVKEAQLSDNTIIAVKISRPTTRIEKMRTTQEVAILEQQNQLISHLSIKNKLVSTPSCFGMRFEVTPIRERTYIAMKKIDGISLHKCWNYFKNTPHRTIQAALSLCEQLQRLHGGTNPQVGGFIHMDISKYNIKYEPETNTITLFDFGLSKPVNSSIAYLGTRGYVAPEVFRNHADVIAFRQYMRLMSCKRQAPVTPQSKKYIIASHPLFRDIAFSFNHEYAYKYIQETIETYPTYQQINATAAQDIYSLGVVLAFDLKAERFRKKFPALDGLLTAMMHTDPHARPSLEQVMHSLHAIQRQISHIDSHVPRQVQTKSMNKVLSQLGPKRKLSL